MAVTVISRPEGHKLNNTLINAVIVDSSGDALIYTAGGHGLADGDYVFIESDFDRYNGFKYVDSVAYDSFKIRESEAGDNIRFVQNADISYFVSVLEHGYQSAHLPIVYELESDLWPTNVDAEAYTPITIVSQEDVNGYTCLNLSTGISDVLDLDYITLIGSGSLSGPYQVLSVISAWKIVINLVYDSDNTFSDYHIEKYYNNYFVRVDVYAGLPYYHTWVDEKTYELAGTINLIPDSDGLMKFSINEILLGYINTENNLSLDSLPNNIDFMTAFYIVYSEYYDVSDGTTITSMSASQQVDSFEGYAINSQMPFQNVGSGFMDDYVSEESNPSRWLTYLDVPQAYVNRIFDLSFINRFSDSDIQITIFKLLNGIVLNTEYITYDNPGNGILRVIFTPSSGYDQYCLQAESSGSPEIIGNTTSVSLPALSDGINVSTGFPGEVSWTLGATPNIVLGGSVGISKYSKPWKQLYSFIDGNSYSITYSVSRSGMPVGSNIQISFVVLNSVGSVVASKVTTNSSGSSTITSTITFTANDCVSYYISIVHTNGGVFSGSGAYTITATSPATTTTPTIPAVPSQIITEQICIDIIDECDSTFTNDDLRLTEGGNLRQIE